VTVIRQDGTVRCPIPLEIWSTRAAAWSLAGPGSLRERPYSAPDRSGGCPRSIDDTIVIQRRRGSGASGVDEIRIPMSLRPGQPLPFQPAMSSSATATLSSSNRATWLPLTRQDYDESARRHATGATLAVAAPDGRILIQIPAVSISRLWHQPPPDVAWQFFGVRASERPTDRLQGAGRTAPEDDGRTRRHRRPATGPVVPSDWKPGTPGREFSRTRRVVPVPR